MRRNILTTFFLIMLVMFSFAFTACSKKTEQSFDVSFYSETGELVSTVNTGEDGATVKDQLLNGVVKEETDMYEYNFVGWYTSEEGGKKIESINEIDGSVSLYPRFEEVLKKFNVRYHNAEGKLIYAERVTFSEASSFYGTLPAKKPSNEYYYEFLEWDKDVTYITEDIDVYPVYNAIPRIYSVTFLNYDGKVLQQGNYKYNDNVSYKGDTPQKPEIEDSVYEFIGWDKPISSVLGNTQYFAVFKKVTKRFVVNFYIDGNVVHTQTVDYGASLSDIPVIPHRTGFDSVWDVDNFDNITSDLTVNAVFTPVKYVVSFNMDGTTTNDCEDIKLNVGEEYELPQFTGFKFGYEFVCWERNGVKYNPGDKFTMNEENVEFKANWRQVEFSIYRGTPRFASYVNDSKIYLFENGVLCVATILYNTEEKLLNTNYTISFVVGKYEYVNTVINARLDFIYNYTYNTLYDNKMSYDIEQYNGNALFIATDNTDYIVSGGEVYYFVSEGNYIEEYVSTDRRALGIVLDNSTVTLLGEDFDFNYAVVLYSDLTVEFTDSFIVTGLDVSTPMFGNFDVLYNNSRFTFEYRVATEEQSKQLEYENVSGDQLYSIGSNIGLYFYNASYCNGYRVENYLIDNSLVNGFDTSTRGVKTLTFNLEQGVFYYDIYVLDNVDDVLEFSAYQNTFVHEVNKHGYNVFKQNSKVTTLGVKYANCSASYLKAASGGDIVDNYVIHEIDVSNINIPTDKIGSFSIKIELEGRLVEVQYSVLDEEVYNKFDSCKIDLNGRKNFVVGETIEPIIKVNYGYGDRCEFVSLDEIENAKLIGLDTKTPGVKVVQLIVDNLLVDEILITVFDENKNDIVFKDYIEDLEGAYLQENVFVVGDIVTELTIKFNKKIYAYDSKEVTTLEGKEVFVVEGLDTRTAGLKTFNLTIDSTNYKINYLVVKEEDYTEIIDFNVVGQVNYLLGENVNLQLELVYGDDFRTELIDATNYIESYDNSTIGNKIITINYKSITKKIMVYYFTSIYGYIDYSYIVDTNLSDFEYITSNVFYIGQKVNSITAIRTNYRMYYNGILISSNEKIEVDLTSQLDTSVIGVKKLKFDLGFTVVNVEYRVLSVGEFNNETGYTVVGKKVLKPEDEVNLNLVIEYANGLRHEVINITEEELPNFNRETLGQQSIAYIYSGKRYVVTLFNYDPSYMEAGEFIEIEYYNTSLSDYYNVLSIDVKSYEVYVNTVLRYYDTEGELVREDDVKLTLIYYPKLNELKAGVNVLEFEIHGKIIYVQVLAE